MVYFLLILFAYFIKQYSQLTDKDKLDAIALAKLSQKEWKDTCKKASRRGRNWKKTETGKKKKFDSIKKERKEEARKRTAENIARLEKERASGIVS